MLNEIFLLLLTIFVPVNCDYCTDKCQFSLSFNEPFLVPENCSKEYGHNYLTCRADLNIDYIQKTIDFHLYADYNMVTGADLYQMDLISSFDQPNEQIKAKLQYSCVYTTECAKNYIEDKLKIILDHQRILYTIKEQLYNPRGSNVQQCYGLQNKTINCINGLCSAEVSGLGNPIPYYKTFCNYYPPEEPFQNTSGLLSTYTYGIPSVFGIFNSSHYVCNRNLCNNNENTDLIQKLVNDFNNFEKISSTTTSPYDNSNHHSNSNNSII